MVVRSALRFGFGTASLLAGGWVLRALQGTPASLGATPAEIAPVARQSPHFRDGKFVNLEPPSGITMDREAQRVLLRDLANVGSAGKPPRPIPLAEPANVDAEPGPAAASWYGHSSVLIEVDGYRVLADPVWSKRCSPSRAVGPHRMHDVPVPLEALPAVDAVLISHDHYDHLDIDTIVALAHSQRSPFLVPLGIGAHLRKWGIPESRIVELDWYESHKIGDLTLVCTPARHFSGRLFTRDTTLWASWVVAGPAHRAYFGGDTGYTKSFAEIGAEYGPFDLTLLPIGAYHPAFADIHMNPEDAVRAHLDLTDVEAGLMVPIHWATFRLAPHPWAEPAERLVAAAEPERVRISIPIPGARVDTETTFEPWWRM
ncbi:putative Zn-dependent hydrolase of beta-lactamase fold protein [Mycolicibacterium chubuense NBB4]|uniref:Putative Zn-dependent hydrolase of beta-lactamase fold protein n=1 Tax=Mycolicibacterium chubuense (strain NBB4) TaxID=710421 RepID=I4BP79_MYCCN|nr:MBL fold metallo-hydrolase [Mycolicibacterium chubuense]AFM19086.1 putative Zn-dependent hydrolase of beta-lactamase fold protein [Mycolicibacterium chubuense NBB4]